MTNNDLQKLFVGLHKAKELKGVKFAYAVVKNIRLIDREIDILKKIAEPSDQYKEYDKQRTDLCEVQAKKDDKGEPIIVNNNYVISDLVSFNKEMLALQDTHKDAINSHAHKLKELEAIMKEDANINLYTISIDSIPEDITGEILMDIDAIIKE